MITSGEVADFRNTIHRYEDTMSFVVARKDAAKSLFQGMGLPTAVEGDYEVYPKERMPSVTPIRKDDETLKHGVYALAYSTFWASGEDNRLMATKKADESAEKPKDGKKAATQAMN